MAAIVFRPAESSDLEQFYDVYSLTYNDGNPLSEDRKNSQFTVPYVALLDGQVAGICHTFDLTCTRLDSVLRCPGIGAVAVYPHLRKSGVGSAMMALLVRHLRETGNPMSSLYAFRETFYRRAGYEVAGKRVRITCPSTRFPRIDSGLPIRRLRPSDWQEIDSCYSAFARSRAGFSLRTEKLWQRVLGENRPLTIYAAGDPVEGYAVVSHSTSFWSTDHIPDVAWTTRLGHAGVLEILSGLSINKTALSWFEPSDSPFLSRYMDQGIEMKLDRPVMYRMCDVPVTLAHLKSEDSGEFSMRVHDDVIPENAGVWRVRFGSDAVVVEAGDNPDFEIDVRHLAQIFLGDPSLSDLARNGFINVFSEFGLNAARRLFIPLPVTCADFF